MFVEISFAIMHGHISSSRSTTREKKHLNPKLPWRSKTKTANEAGATFALTTLGFVSGIAEERNLISKVSRVSGAYLV